MNQKSLIRAKTIWKKKSKLGGCTLEGLYIDEDTVARGKLREHTVTAGPQQHRQRCLTQGTPALPVTHTAAVPPPRRYKTYKDPCRGRPLLLTALALEHSLGTQPRDRQCLSHARTPGPCGMFSQDRNHPDLGAQGCPWLPSTRAWAPRVREL